MGTEPRGAWRLKDGVAEDWTPRAGWHGARTPADPLADLQALVAAARAGGRSRARRVLERRGRLLLVRYRATHRAAAERAAARDLGARCAVRLHARARDHRCAALAGARRRRRAGERGRERRRAAARARRRDARHRRDDRAAARAREPRAARPRSRRRRPRRARPTTRARSSRRMSSASGSTSSRATASRRCSRGASRCRSTSIRPTLYRALRALNPSPYMYHLVLDGLELVGSSPELLVRVAGRARHRAPDRGHAPARAHARGRRATRGRAARRREGARRARDARRPRPQRCRTHREVRHRRGDGSHGRRAVQPRLSHREPGGGAAARTTPRRSMSSARRFPRAR